MFDELDPIIEGDELKHECVDDSIECRGCGAELEPGEAQYIDDAYEGESPFCPACRARIRAIRRGQHTEHQHIEELEPRTAPESTAGFLDSLWGRL